MEFDTDIFFLLTQLCVIYGGTVEVWQKELDDCAKDGIHSREEILTCWQLLVDDKIDELMTKVAL